MKYLLIFVLFMTSCCSWAKKNCSQCNVPVIISQTEFVYKTPTLLPEVTAPVTPILDRTLAFDHPNNIYAILIKDVRLEVYIFLLESKIYRYEESIKEIDAEQIK